MAMRSMALKAWRGGPGRLGHIFFVLQEGQCLYITVNVLFTYDIHRFIYCIYILH